MGWEAGSEGSPGMWLLPLSPLGTDALETNPPGSALNMQRLRHQDACLEDSGQSLVLIKCQLTS